MKLCLFSDLHGNWPVFKVALDFIRKESADLNLCLGDICGYYPDVTKIIDELRSMPRLVTIKGNHDDMFVRAANGEEGLQSAYLSKYGPALETFLKENNLEALKWLAGLPLIYKNKELGLAAFHGSPQRPLEGYIYPSDSLAGLRRLKLSWCFLGQTHYSMNRKIGRLRVVNPGSLGQPRDGCLPQFAVINLKKNGVKFHQVPFDWAGFSKRMMRWAPDFPYLSDVWKRIVN